MLMWAASQGGWNWPEWIVRPALWLSIAILAVAAILWLKAGYDWKFGGEADRKQFVEDHLPTLAPEVLAWLRKMLSGGRPVGIPDTVAQRLERTGLYERDFTGPKGIVPGFES